MTQTQQMTPARDYKSRLFAMVFSEKDKLLELYNAVSGKNYDDPEQLTINTLENAIYMSMKNDLSFIIDFRLSLYEHQSTYNPNMPLRFLFYLSELYSPMTRGKNIYGKTLIQIPPPRFIVFYNGREKRPVHEVMNLSDAYMMKDRYISLDLKVEVYNINIEENCELLDLSKTLRDYSEFVWRVRDYAQELPIEEAVDRAIDECIQEDILREFLEQNRAEAKTVCIYEYDEEEHMRMEREESFEEGFQAGIKEEQANMEKEKARAEDAERRAEDAEQRAEIVKQELQKVRDELERLKRNKN